MPLACSASTWSFISEMSGETTTVSPSRQGRQLETERFAAAGRHKHKDIASGQRVANDLRCNSRNFAVAEMILERSK